MPGSPAASAQGPPPPRPGEAGGGGRGWVTLTHAHARPRSPAGRALSLCSLSFTPAVWRLRKKWGYPGVTPPNSGSVGTCARADGASTRRLAGASHRCPPAAWEGGAGAELDAEVLPPSYTLTNLFQVSDFIRLRSRIFLCRGPQLRPLVSGLGGLGSRV